MGKFLSLFLLIFTVLGAEKAMAQGPEAFNNTGLPIPRFVSLRSDKVFVRSGPALRYPIKWVFVRENMPVEITQEFDTWRKVRGIGGEEGWIHQSLLSGQRFGVVQAEDGAILLRKADSTAKPVALLEKDVIVALEGCENMWCKAEAGSFKGWIERKSLWGVYQQEELD